jgi:hypothetical protein
VCLPVVLLSCQRQNHLRQLILTRRLRDYASAEHSHDTDLVLYDPGAQSRTVPSMRVQSRSPWTKHQEPTRARSKGRHRYCNRSARLLFAFAVKDACISERDVRARDGRLTDDDHPDPCQRTESGPRIYILSCKSQQEVQGQDQHWLNLLCVKSHVEMKHNDEGGRNGSGSRRFRPGSARFRNHKAGSEEEVA